MMWDVHGGGNNGGHGNDSSDSDGDCDAATSATNLWFEDISKSSLLKILSLLFDNSCLMYYTLSFLKRSHIEIPAN